MKLLPLFCIMCLCLVLTFPIHAQCPSLDLDEQIQVDSYANTNANCHVISGDVIISGAVTNLRPLSFIKEIHGDLIISNTDITSLYHVFQDLQSIGGDLVIDNNPQLGSISSGFPLLESIGGSLSVEGNDALFVVNGLDRLESIAGGLYLSYNNLLSEIPAFNTLKTTSEIEILGNGLLHKIVGFSYLEDINGDLYIEDNPVLQHIEAFKGLMEVENLSIALNSKLESLSGFDKLIETQAFYIGQNEGLTSLSGFDYLETASSVGVVENFSLQQIQGFARLYQITGHLDITDNASLIYINAFGALKRVGGRLSISSNDQLPSIIGFQHLHLIEGNLLIGNNPMLERIQAMGKLVEVGGVLQLERNTSLYQVSPFTTLSQIGTQLTLAYNGFKVLGFLPSLRQIGGSMTIRNEVHLQEIRDFANLRTIGGSLNIEFNPVLKSIGGFGKLNSVGVSLNMNFNEALVSISGFNALSSLGLDIFINDNPSLVYIKGFSPLEALGDDLRILRNDQLASIFAFENLATLDFLEVRLNPELRYCCGLATLIGLGGYNTASISGNAEGCNSVMEIEAACNATLSDCAPNCIGSINVALDRFGFATMRPADFISDTMACAGGVEVTIEDRLGRIVYGPRLLGLDAIIAVKACHLLRQQPLKITTRGGGGACWTDLTFKNTDGPTLQGEPTQTVLCGDPLSVAPLPGTKKYAWVPCQAELEADWITDWVTTYDCDPGVQDTVKVIYREWEAFDKDGKRGVVFDTIVVLQLPEILPENIYCEEKDTVYCADTTAQIGPYITYLDPLSNTCVQTPLIRAGDRNDDGILEFYPTRFDNKCGISVHVDSRRFPGSCETSYRVTVDVKQHCYGMGSLACQVIPPAGTPPNMAEMIDTGYWRCEFWVVDLDTLAPELVCKGDSLFSGPFDINKFKLYDDFFGIASTAIPVALVNQGLAESKSNFNTDNLPYQLLVESQHIQLDDFVINTLDDIEAGFNGFSPVPYYANAVAAYEAERDQVFSFSWDFTLAPFINQNNPQSLQATQDYAYASVFYSVNGSSYRLVQGEEMPGFIPPATAFDAQSLVGNNSLNMVAPVATSQSQHGFAHIPLKAGDKLHIVAIWDSPVETTFRIMGLNQVSTNPDECLATTYLPPLWVNDDWSGVKQAKAKVEDLGTFQLEYDTANNCWLTHSTLDLPHRDEAYKIIFEAYDSCHNIGYDSCYLYVKDLVKPVPVVDKGFTVSLSDKKVWMGVKAFDEGSKDNCAMNLVLIRRQDWLESCMDLCDSMEVLCVTDHHDTIWKPYLQPDKRIDEVEAHYAQALGWIKNETEACGELLYNAWIYDLIKYGTTVCQKGEFQLTDEGFNNLLDSCAYEIEPYFEDVMVAPGDTRSVARLSHGLLNTYAQLGGGWSKEVPFSCEDACGPVTVEVLTMDYWCNWAIGWTKVWVEDQYPVEIREDIESAVSISCKSFRDSKYMLPDSSPHYSIEDLVDLGMQGDSVAFEALDNIFGGFEKAWVDPYGEYVDIDGNPVDRKIRFSDSICYCTSYYKEVRVRDEYGSYHWVDSLVTECYYLEDSLDLIHGIVQVNCAGNVYCSQEVWSDIDHCGEGYIQRKFKIWQSCPDEFYHSDKVPDSLKHPVDTLIRQQRIWVGNNCPLSKYMFEVPEDTTIISCGIVYDDHGNVTGDADPDQIGEAIYKFDDDCRLVGITHNDRVFQIVGGGENACFKIQRTWYFADWCTYGESTNPNWWKDYDLVLDSCVQTILLVDTIAPQCQIYGPVMHGDTLEVGTCDYDLEVEVEADDICGIMSYSWKLFATDEGDYSMIASFDDQKSGSNAFSISIPDLDFGSYELKVTVEDACGNESSCNYAFTLISVKKPTAICLTSITARLVPWDLDFDGTADSSLAIIWASEYNQSSQPACGDDYLEYRIEFLDGVGDETYEDDADSLVVSCAHVGAQLVRMWMISQPSGTADYCDVVLVVQSDGSCSDPGQENELESNIVERQIQEQPVRSHHDDRVVVIPADAASTSVYPKDSEGFVLEQNRPNPFQHSTTIEFNLPFKSDVTLTLFDPSGRELYRVEGDFAKGRNQILLPASRLVQQGVIYYRLSAGSYTAVMKMVKL